MAVAVAVAKDAAGLGDLGNRVFGSKFQKPLGANRFLIFHRQNNIEVDPLKVDTVKRDVLLG